MTGTQAEIWDLKVDRCRVPVSVENGKIDPIEPLDGDGWIVCAVEILEDGETVMGHYLRRRGVKRG